MKRRLLALFTVLGIVIAGCSSGSGAPETFDGQPGPLSSDLTPYSTELVGDLDASAVPLVHRNFLEGCFGDGSDRFPDAAGATLSGADLASACGCAYVTLSDLLIDNPPPDKTAFDTFVELSNDLESEGTLSATYDAPLQAACRS